MITRIHVLGAFVPACLLMLLGNISAQVTTLHTFNGPSKQSFLGYSVSGAGDVNKDGHADFIVGAEGASPGGRLRAGQATVFSGKDGSVIHRFDGLASGDDFGVSVSGAGDVNKDGFPDLIVGAYLADPQGRMSAGQATVFSGKDGSVIHTFNGVCSGDMFGNSVAGAGDMNSDGYADLIVGAWGAASGAGQALVFSGRDGAVLATFQGLGSGSGFGRSVADVGDMNRDSFPELAVGAPMADPGGLLDSGQATVYSIPTPYIAGAGNPGIGGTVTLDLLAPGDQSLPFQVGSSLGTGPIVLGSRALGLSLDGLLAVSVNNAWPWMFQDYRGVIDGNARARAALHIPNLPALIGTRVHTAFVTLSPQAPFGIQSISNTETITIAK